MSDFAEQNQRIRKFLLGKLSEEEAEKVEDRIFSEPEFGEEVEIVEEELMSDYAAGRLSPEVRVLFEQKYSRTPENRREFEYRTAFNEVITAKASATSGAAQVEELQPQQSVPQTSRVEAISPSGRNTSWFQNFIWRPATIVVGFVVLLSVGIVVWLLFGPDKPTVTAQRQMIEERLKSINATTALRPTYPLAADLRPIERSEGQIVRIVLSSGEPNRFIEFHLNLAQEGTERYRVLFLDDKSNELFAVDDLTGVMTTSGQQVQFFVPGEYLKPGDYQIELSVADRDRGRRIVNAYAFRVVETR